MLKDDQRMSLPQWPSPGWKTIRNSGMPTPSVHLKCFLKKFKKVVDVLRWLDILTIPVAKPLAGN
jgi:hypothetical protein